MSSGTKPHTGTASRRVVVFATAVLLCLITLLAAAAVWLLRDPEFRMSARPVARYGSFTFEGRRTPNGQHFIQVFTGDFGPRKAMLYVKVPNGQVFEFDSMPENFIAGLLERHEDPQEGAVYYGSPDGSNFVYFNHRQEFAKITRTLNGFQFGPSKDGPFVSLPINREVLVRLFGEPVEWGEKSRPRVP